MTCSSDRRIFNYMNRRFAGNFRLLGVFFLVGSAASAGTVQYLVSVDSSGIGSGTPGIIEIQFNQANSTTSLSALASVTVLSVSGYTGDSTADQVSPGVTGNLANPPLLIPNDASGTNYADQGVGVFGSGFSFTVTFTGAAIGGSATDGSGFYLFLLDRSLNPLVGPLGSGEIANVIVNGDGSTTGTGSTFTGGSATVSLYTPTPEPSTLFTGFGLTLFGAAFPIWRRNRRQSV